MSSNIKVQRVCKFCGSVFIARTTVTKFCGDNCAKRAYKARMKGAKIEASNNETRQLLLIPYADLQSKPFLSISDTSKLFGISRRTIHRILKKGKLPFGKAGNRTILKRIDIENLLFNYVNNHSGNLNDTHTSINSVATDDNEKYYTKKQAENVLGVSSLILNNLLKQNKVDEIIKDGQVYLNRIVIDKLSK